MTDAVDEVAALLDATAPGLGAADVVLVFGSTLPQAVPPAAVVMHAGLAPVVVTGGPNRRIPAHIESEVNARLLIEAGIPADRILIERQSTTTTGNVQHARQIIENRLGEVHTVIALVKWWHRRALHVLAAGMPSVDRIYAVTWDPPARATGTRYTRATWSESADRTRIEGEHRYFKAFLDRGDLPPLHRDGHGWVRG